jgi:hypothetical protein
MAATSLCRVISVFLLAAATTAVFAQPPTAPPASKHKEITLPHETLARYVGTYKFLVFTMEITLEDEQLQTKMDFFSKSAGKKVPVFAESETKFFPKAFEGSMEFKLNSAGEVTALVMHQSIAVMWLRRVKSTVTEHK